MFEPTEGSVRLTQSSNVPDGIAVNLLGSLTVLRTESPLNVPVVLIFSPTKSITLLLVVKSGISDSGTS